MTVNYYQIANFQLFKINCKKQHFVFISIKNKQKKLVNSGLVVDM